MITKNMSFLFNNTSSDNNYSSVTQDNLNTDINEPQTENTTNQENTTSNNHDLDSNNNENHESHSDCDEDFDEDYELDSDNGVHPGNSEFLIKLPDIFPEKYSINENHSTYVIQINNIPRYYVDSESEADRLIWELARKINFEIFCEYGNSSKIYINETIDENTNIPLLKIERLTLRPFFLSSHSTLVEITYHCVDKLYKN